MSSAIRYCSVALPRHSHSIILICGNGLICKRNSFCGRPKSGCRPFRIFRRCFRSEISALRARRGFYRRRQLTSSRPRLQLAISSTAKSTVSGISRQVAYAQGGCLLLSTRPCRRFRCAVAVVSRALCPPLAPLFQNPPLDRRAGCWTRPKEPGSSGLQPAAAGPKRPLLRQCTRSDEQDDLLELDRGSTLVCLRIGLLLPA
ncbi:hypothetical protein SAMN03159463_04214 [Mesorhizobium sp. NFR06]|nr:hypothetical protein SAMN03159463_04214 [Mesorhizobium sp. NFR06]